MEPRNTPTMHGAAFNFDNFWDGRARFNYNGGSVFGPSDPQAHIFINPGLATAAAVHSPARPMGDIRPDLLVEDPEVAEQPVRIKFSSLASQSDGPPLSDFEMSFAGRNWAKIGKKLLQGTRSIETGTGAAAAGTNRVNAALANQLVATDDSRLGPFSNQGGSRVHALGRPTALGKPGLCISYPDLIRLAFARAVLEHGIHDRCTVERRYPADCDPFDGYRAHRRQRCGESDQHQPVHPDGGELQPLLRAVGAGLRVATDPGRHAGRPVLRRQSATPATASASRGTRRFCSPR